MYSGLANTQVGKNLKYEDPVPVNANANYNKGLIQGFHRMNQDMNGKLAGRLGFRDINTLADNEYNRLVNLLNRLANM